MNKTYGFGGLLLIAAVTTVISCSSGNKSADETPADIAEATADSTATGTGTDPAASLDGSMDPSAAAPTDSMATDSMAADANAAPTDPNAAAVTDPNQSSSTDPNAAASTAPTDSGATASAAPEASPAPTDTASNDLFGGAITAGDGGSVPAEEKPKKASLAHIKSKPFKKGGQLLNTVYIAREGDTLDSVSERLFGENKVKELKKANPSLKVNLKPGDKVYFNSPNRPDDNEKMMTVYEDQGLPPTAYTTKEGDTLKSLSMEWYGTESGYKEIYALNKNVNSTTELAPGTELQYWPSSVSVMAYAKKPEGGSDVAQNPPVQEEPAPPAPPPVAEVIPPPPPTGPAPDMMGQNNMGAMPGAGSMNNSVPPPPPPPDLNAPAFPPPPTMAKKKPAATEVMDKDTIMYAVAAGVLLIGGGALVAIRRRSNKRNQGITQV